MDVNSNESWATRLYRGEKSYPIVAKRRWWYTGSAVVMVIGIISIIVFGLNPSIDFKGGAVFQGPLNGHSLSDVVSAVESTGIKPELQQTTGTGKAERFRIETATLTTLGGQSQADKIENALDAKLGISPNSLSVQTIGSTWGGQITHKAILGLIIFLIAVTGYMTVRFEWKMALAAIIALIHDLVITAGIYALSGLQVSPSTVIALLTILGYSLYDTVVVFDKVRENTAGITGGSRMTFSQAANLAVNQTLVRSINTSIIALLPVAGLLVIGVGVLGAGSLQDLSFALLIGLASGAYSSIFIATPLVCEFKEREPAYQQLARRVAARRTKESTGSDSGAVPATVGAPLAAAAASDASPAAAPPATAQTSDAPADQGAQPGQPAPAARPARPGQPSRGSSRNARRGRPSGRSKSRKRR
jgi:preprotein translocase subunit SecF